MSKEEILRGFDKAINLAEQNAKDAETPEAHGYQAGYADALRRAKEVVEAIEFV